VKPGDPKVSFEREATATPDHDLRQYSRKLRELQAKATPKSTFLPTIEQNDPALADALLRLSLFETAEHHRLVAAAYRHAGVTDHAYRHYQRALRLDACDSAAFEGLAQIWRDWKMPDLALSDAYRALRCKPESPSAHNTLGTVFYALGQTENARRAFERAAELDGRATFALNNLCYIFLREGDGRAAQEKCERALAADPAMTAARMNLAAAYIMQGEISGAERRLLEHPDSAIAHFSVGMLRMSMREYVSAAEAFDMVVSERPSSREARRRAAQAHNQVVANRGR
jgi:Flp pilus assembly protein TadD